MVVNTPSNPAGKVFTRAELEGLAAIAAEFDLFVFSWMRSMSTLFMAGREHVSPAVIPGMWERTILMSGFSKTFR